MTQEYIKNFLEKTVKQAGLTGEDALISYELAKFLNEQDKLKHLRDEFFYPKMGTLPHGTFWIIDFGIKILVDRNLVDENEDSIYLCGNSLGLLPKATPRITDGQFKQWAEM